jgi:hypothetical protein
MKEQEGGRPQRELTRQTETNLVRHACLPDRQGGNFHQEKANNNPLFSLVEQKLSDASTRTPAGEDPAYWPIPVLDEINYLIVNRENTTQNSSVAANSVIGERAAQMKETIRRVKTAYEILAYPHCKDKGRKECIEADLEGDRQMFARDQVELSNEELNMLAKLAGARNIPVVPDKKIYSYAEVPISSHIDPFGKRLQTTDEIRKEPLEGVVELKGTYK